MCEKYLPLTKPDLRCLYSYSYEDVGGPVIEGSFFKPASRLTTQTDLISETLCSFVFLRIQHNGKIKKKNSNSEHELC
jgi:hypothetical protein